MLKFSAYRSRGKIMGQTDSSPNYHSESLWFYNKALEKPCLFPDVGIDESLLRYSGSDSSAVLQAYSNDLVNTVPGYVRSFGSAIGSLNSVPNAVGLGALVISLIIEIIMKGGAQTSDDTYSLLRRVFGEEKASCVRDTMSEYLKRHRMYMNNDHRLPGEIRRLEQQLSNHLTVLRNSLVHDGQMSSRGFKIWVNGAAFHVQMLIHEARLDIQTSGKPASYYLNAIEAAIDLYLQDLDNLLEKYKTYKINSGIFWHSPGVSGGYMGYNFAHVPPVCSLINNDNKNCVFETTYASDCSGPKMATPFMDIVYSNYEPIKGLKSYFLNIKKNLNSLIHQHDSFTVPSATG